MVNVKQTWFKLRPRLFYITHIVGGASASFSNSKFTLTIGSFEVLKCHFVVKIHF